MINSNFIVTNASNILPIKTLSSQLAFYMDSNLTDADAFELRFQENINVER